MAAMGYAIVCHNGPLSRHQVWTVGATSRRATGAADRLHRGRGVRLDPMGTQRRSSARAGSDAAARPSSGPGATHHAAEVGPRDARRPPQCVHELPDALLRAAATFPRPRPACGLLAAAVAATSRPRRPCWWALQQNTAPEASVRAARRRLRHRARTEALSEIDFVRLCRIHGLPAPHQQTVRHDVAGRRRYLDATWRRGDGRLVVVEVDGALHLVATTVVGRPTATEPS